MGGRGSDGSSAKPPESGQAKTALTAGGLLLVAENEGSVGSAETASKNVATMEQGAAGSGSQRARNMGSFRKPIEKRSTRRIVVADGLGASPEDEAEFYKPVPLETPLQQVRETRALQPYLFTRERTSTFWTVGVCACTGRT